MTNAGRCPITYAPLAADEEHYARRGLRLLDPKLDRLEPLPFTPEELRAEAAARVEKMSIAGVQPKVSAWLNVSAGRFELTDRSGRWILKPPVPDWPEIPQNEDLTMRLAAMAGIDVPDHGLVYMKDGSLCYVVHRFDRLTRDRKLHVEDFAQLTGLDRETKYDASMEKVAAVIDEFCAFPMVEKEKLFRRVVVSSLLGNEDMHLKNFSLIRDERDVVRLSPAYDLVNTTIVLTRPREQLALPLRGKKSNFNRGDLVDYYGRERLGLSEAAVDFALGEIGAALLEWERLIETSFLTPAMKEKYATLLEKRLPVIGLSA